jgi:uncharacterized membrane protein
VQTEYRRFSGTSLARLAALSDGVFAVALTLLVLDLRVPVLHIVQAESPLWSAGTANEARLAESLVGVLPSLLTYGTSFLTLGIFWIAQQTQLSQVSRGDRDLTWLNLLFLAAVCVMPFTTSVLAAFITLRLPLLLYWANLLLLGMVLLATLRYAQRAGLRLDGLPREVFVTQQRRILIYQACYAVVVLIGVVNVTLAIGGLILLQLNSAVDPRGRLAARSGEKEVRKAAQPQPSND